MLPPPRRLIEVALPFQELEQAAERERSVRHGHPATLHVWWARRPLTACRGVLLATLLLDPSDASCPARFREVVGARLRALAACGKAVERDWESASELRDGLVAFVRDFSRWEATGDQDLLATSRALVEAAHESLRRESGRPLVVDPFAGGGSFPLEALRVGADALASDINPLAVLIEKLMLEYAPRMGASLVEDIRRVGAWVDEQARARLMTFFPALLDRHPSAYLWARVIRCGRCSTDIPLLRSPRLAGRRGRSIALRLVPEVRAHRIDVQIVEYGRAEQVREEARSIREEARSNGAVVCPVCGVLMSPDSVRAQLRAQRGGAANARLVTVVERDTPSGKLRYRPPAPGDFYAVRKAAEELERLEAGWQGPLTLVPSEEIAHHDEAPLVRLGVVRWRDLFTPRQQLSLATLTELIREGVLGASHPDGGEALAIALAFCLDRVANGNSTCTRWSSSSEQIEGTFSRPWIGTTWEFAECNPWAAGSGSWMGAVGWVADALAGIVGTIASKGRVAVTTASNLPSPSGSADLIATDPPRVDAVPYGFLSDFFYVWLRRVLHGISPVVGDAAAPPGAEIIGVNRLGVEADRDQLAVSALVVALEEARRVLRPDGACVLAFSGLGLAEWMAQLKMVWDAGWTVTAAWPARSERLWGPRAHDLFSLSYYLVCWPRSALGVAERVGSWADLRPSLRDLVRERLLWVGVGKAAASDSFIVCVGASLATFAAFARVEDSGARAVHLDEYLRCVLEMVVHEALGILLEGQAERFEPDARLTVVWLWTLSSGRQPHSAIELESAKLLMRALGSELQDAAEVVQVQKDAAQLIPGRARLELLGMLDGRVPSTTLSRIQLAMVHAEDEDSSALRRLLVQDGAGRDDRFWRLARVLSEVYPVGSASRRWLKAVLASKKELGL